MDIEPSLTSFQEDDAVLYLDLPEALTKHTEAGGQLSDATEALSNSYEGIEDMTAMVMSWVDIYGNGVHAFEDAVETVLRENEQSITQRLQEILPSLRDSHRVMAQIASSGRWNPAVSEIADRHRSSTLFNMLTREARLVDAGVPSAQLLSPDVFLNVVCEQLTSVFEDGATVDDDVILKLYKRLSAICTYDECVMACSLRLFSEMSRAAEQPAMRAMFRRIGQEVRKAAVDVITSAKIVPPVTARQYVVRMAINIDCAAVGVRMPKSVMDALLALMSSVSGKRPYDKEIKIILDAYKNLLGPLEIGFYGEPKENSQSMDEVTPAGVSNSKKAMDKAMFVLSLCHIEVYDDLLYALFTNAHRVQQEVRRRSERNQTRRRCISLLLAYASVFIIKDFKEITEILSGDSPQGTYEKVREDVKAKYCKFEILGEACEALYPGCARFVMKGAKMDVILEATNDPFLAPAVLIWASEGIKGGENSQNLLMTAPTHLAVMEKVAKDHPVLRKKVMKAIREALKRDLASMEDIMQVDLRDMYMKSLVSMVSVEMAPELIQEFLEHFADDSLVDDSLRRRFVGGVLTGIDPPYSKPFAALVLRLLQHQRTASVVETDQNISNMAIQFRRLAYGMGVS